MNLPRSRGGLVEKSQYSPRMLKVVPLGLMHS